jgi:sialate O-acetylesterase
MNALRTLSAALLVLAPSALAQDLSLPAVFGDHMVLQRETSVAFWGRGPAGTIVEVSGSWGGEVARGTVAPDGDWRVDLPTGAAGGPHTVIVSAGGRKLEYTDVLLGEVWVCGGQSNMEWSMDATADGFPSREAYDAVVAAADHPQLRLFDVAHQHSWAEQEDVTGSWKACTPEAVRSFSAVGYHFGREVHAETGVPVGLISCNWGGTLCEAWTSKEKLAERGDFGDGLALVEELTEHPERARWKREQRLDEWRAAFTAAETGSRAGWMSPDLDDAGWPEMELPASWTGSLGGFDGIVWFRRTVELPEAWAGRDLVLELGPIDDMDSTWFNGELIGEHMDSGQWATPRRYTVPGALVKGGGNLIAVRAYDTAGTGGLNGKPEQMSVAPAGGGQGPALMLAGPWKWQKGSPHGELPGKPNVDEFHPNSPTALYNGMLAPITPYGIRGAIWYQGESNRMRAMQYRTLFPDMIADWRDRFERGDFPFYFVQLAPFSYGGDTGQAGDLRDAQRRALGMVPNSGMAVTMDIGNPGDIHPRNKVDVGHRLALWALAKDYGRHDLVFSGPLYYGMRVEEGRVRLFFDHAEGLATSDGQAPSCFTVAGPDRVFHPATAEIVGQQVLVTSEAVPAPQFVRYGGGAADPPNVVNGAGLPMASFNTGS